MDLLILNKNFENDYPLDVYESVIWTDRYYEYGDFEIYTVATKEIIDRLKSDYYLWNSESEHLMIIDESKIETDAESGNHLIVKGKSLESLLLRRIVWNQTVLNGSLETEIEKLLNLNVINPSDPNRKIPNFVFKKSGDSYIESIKIEAQYTGDVIYDVISDICKVFSIGFKIILDQDNNFVFSFYSGTDRSYDQIKNPYTIFSPNFENIINSGYRESKTNYSNITLVAGEGEDVNRRTRVVGDLTASGIERRELYTDARDISSTDGESTLSEEQYNNLLEQRGQENLQNHKITKEFDGEVETSQLYRYKEDFFMGDIVVIENEYGLLAGARILEYIYSEDQNGTKSYPTFEVLNEYEEEEA